MNDLVRLLEDRVKRASERIESLRKDNETLRARLGSLESRPDPPADQALTGGVERERIVAILRDAVAELRAD